MLPADVPTLVGRGRRVTFGWDRWADDVGRHRPLRRLGARARGRSSELGFTAEQRRRRGPAQLLDDLT